MSYISLDVFLWVFLVYFIVEVSVYCARGSTVYSLYTTLNNLLDYVVQKSIDLLLALLTIIIVLGVASQSGTPKLNDISHTILHFCL